MSSVSSWCRERELRKGGRDKEAEIVPLVNISTCNDLLTSEVSKKGEGREAEEQKDIGPHQFVYHNHLVENSQQSFILFCGEFVSIHSTNIYQAHAMCRVF